VSVTSFCIVEKFALNTGLHWLHTFNCGLFKGALSISDYMAQNGMMTYELERIRKEAIMTKLRYYPGTCLVGLRKTTKNMSG
jgi:hypothetical protein